MAKGRAAPVSRSFRGRLLAIFTCSNSLPEKSSGMSQALQQSKPSSPLPPSAKIANYEPYTPLLRRGGSVAASRSSTAVDRSNSTSGSVPHIGELKTCTPSLKKSTSRGLSKLRDQYVDTMMKLGDMSNSVNFGDSMTFDSQVFESEGTKKKSQMESEIMEFYLQSGIQPGEWKDARMGSRIMRNNPSIAV